MEVKIKKHDTIVLYGGNFRDFFALTKSVDCAKELLWQIAKQAFLTSEDMEVLTEPEPSAEKQEAYMQMQLCSMARLIENSAEKAEARKRGGQNSHGGGAPRGNKNACKKKTTTENNS